MNMIDDDKPCFNIVYFCQTICRAEKIAMEKTNEFLSRRD
jgi:hypothetical protein